MRRNRKLSAKGNGVMNSLSVRIAALILLGVTMTIFNVLEKSTCGALSSDLGRQERELRQLEGDYQRESSRLAGMMVPDKLDDALARNGMAMRLPHPEQQVKMSASGRPLPGQMSLVKMARVQGVQTAQYRARGRARSRR